MTEDLALYGALRAQLLSRHFALGRYSRADHLSIFNNLGVVHQAGSGTPDTGNDLVHGCLWSPNEAIVVQPAEVYADAAHLQSLSADQGLFERWRVGDHSRANPLMYSAHLMVCLAVETVLGIPGSKDILSRLLATTGSLYKYSTPPFDGYIARWDPVTSDHWTTMIGENATLVGDCCDFLIDSDAPGGYLYCTPLDDPRYVPYISQDTFNKLSDSDKTAWQNGRILALDMTRYWEPSLDELTGLIAGYSFVHAVVPDPGIQAQVSEQVTRLAGYLAANSYFLVRPEGGFAAQGAQAMAPAVEYPFGRVFSRITGSEYSSQTNFEGALRNAKLWSQFSTWFVVGTITGPGAAVLLALLLFYFGAALGGLLGAIITAVGGVEAFIGLVTGGAIFKAGALYVNRGAFDVRSWPGSPGTPGYPYAKYNDSEQTAFAQAYLVRQLPGKKLRFTATMTGLTGVAGISIGKYSQNFPPFFGLSALNDSDGTVRKSYLAWLAGRRSAGDVAANNDAFASAVAVILGSGQAEQEMLVSLLEQVATNFDVSQADNLTIYGDSSEYDGSPYVTESAHTTGGEPNPNNPGVPSALTYMAALALAWYYSKAQADAGTPVPPGLGFPEPPPSGTALPAATIPAAVIQATSGGAPAQVIPLSALPPLPDPLLEEIDLFSASAPGKPADPAPPATTVRWLFSDPVSHSGIGWGSGTDTPNAGKRVTGWGCKILGVKLELVDSHGVPLGDLGTTTTIFAQQQANVGRADAVVGWPSTAGARLVGNEINATAEMVTVQWWYDIGRACRYRIGYLVEGTECSLGGTMPTEFICTIDGVQAASNLQNPPNSNSIVSVILTDTKGSFTKTVFDVRDEIKGEVLDVALAAISRQSKVLAVLDPPTTAPWFCYRLGFDID